MTQSHRIIAIELDDGSILRRTPEVEHERAVAIADLLDENQFSLTALEGPYALFLSVKDDRLTVDATQQETENHHRVTVPMRPFRKIIRDYFMLCESYYEAIKTATPARIEAIDMGRRGIHNDASQQLMEQVNGDITMDFETARRLFTLICVLHIR